MRHRIRALKTCAATVSVRESRRNLAALASWACTSATSLIARQTTVQWKLHGLLTYFGVLPDCDRVVRSDMVALWCAVRHRFRGSSRRRLDQRSSPTTKPTVVTRSRVTWPIAQISLLLAQEGLLTTNRGPMRRNEEKDRVY